MQGETIWDDSEPAYMAMAMIEYLFEHRSKESIKENGKGPMNSSIREIIILDNKRSNAINIGMTKLPSPRIIKPAVMKMDGSIMCSVSVSNDCLRVQPKFPRGAL